MATIFVLDESNLVLAIATMTLEKEGHEVLCSTSSVDAFKALHERTIDLLIMDVFEPEKGGLEVMIEARRLCPQLKLIAMISTADIPAIVPMTRSFGEVGTLPKPFDEEDMDTSVALVLGLRNSPAPAPNPDIAAWSAS